VGSIRIAVRVHIPLGLNELQVAGEPIFPIPARMPRESLGVESRVFLINWIPHPPATSGVSAGFTYKGTTTRTYPLVVVSSKKAPRKQPNGRMQTIWSARCRVSLARGVMNM